MAGLTDYSKFQEYNTPKKRELWPVLFFLLLLSLFLFIIAKTFFVDKKEVVEVISPIAKEIIDTGTALFNPDKNSENLERIVQKELTNTQGDYAVSIKNLKTKERYYFNEHKIFDTASLYKLFVMVTAFQKIQAGDLNKGDILSQKIEVLNDKFGISSESAELTEGNITLPVQSALTRMITISDNYSALLLAEKIRLSQVALFLSQSGLTESRVGTKGETPASSAHDLTLFLEKLYLGEFADKSLTQDMLTLLKNQKLNGKIPKYLPINAVISHKTGELGRLSHDVGIIYTPKGDYVIVILTDTSRPAETNEKIAVISKSVYDYFTK